VTDFFLRALITVALTGGPQYNVSPCMPNGTAFPPLYTQTDVLVEQARMQLPTCTIKVVPTPPPIIPGKPPRECDAPTYVRPLLPSCLRRALP
jgi:hypothetical protein